MTTPYLPDDCIYDILKHLQIYHSTLFNCLLVNRFWCKATVPLLYVDPFDIRNKKIILTLILFFNKAEILQLKKQLKLSNIDNKIINNTINIKDGYKPLFEYLKYLENYDCDKLNNIIVEWFQTSREKLNKFILMFHQPILYQCNNLKQLNISLNSFFLRPNDNDNKIDNKIAPEFLSSISNNIANICLRKSENIPPSINISDIDIVKEKLCASVQKQNNLKVIKLSFYCKDFLNDIFLHLEFQKRSLVHVELQNINFCNISFENFINLCNLKYLKFEYCMNVSLDQCETLDSALFKLEVLILQHNGWNDDITSLMIKYLGASLNKLTLLDENPKISTIENISKYCSNLITLGIRINSFNIDKLVFPCFKNLKIRILNITIHYADDQIFANLAKNLSKDVKEISFVHSNRFRCIDFEKFLENCHDFLEVISLDCCIELDHLKIILNYIERSNGSLKFLDIVKPEESTLLDQIKAKGVKIDFIIKMDDDY